MKIQSFSIFIYYFTFSNGIPQNRLGNNLMLLKLRKYSINVPSRGRHERYPGTHRYRNNGQYPAKFQNLSYRWVPRAEEILEVGYHWVSPIPYRVPAREKFLGTGNRPNFQGYRPLVPSLQSETMLEMIGSRTGREELKTFIKNFVKPTDQRFKFYRDYLKNCSTK